MVGLRNAMNACILALWCWSSPSSAQTSQAPSRIDGVWATNSGDCPAIFTKMKHGKGRKAFFNPNSEAFGSGFVIEKDRIRGRMLSCKILRRIEVGDTTHLIASCSSNVLLENVQFSLRQLDDNHIVRVYPGIPELQFTFARCKH